MGNDIDLKAFFKEIKTVAVVGYSDNPDRAGHYVAEYLANEGYEIISVNPKFGDEINGHKNFKTLMDIPKGTQVDVIDLFRAAPYVPKIVEAALTMDPRPKYVVMQPGTESDEGEVLARDNGIIPLRSCMMAAHKIWK